MTNTGKAAARAARRKPLAAGFAVMLAVALAMPGAAFADVGQGETPLDIRVDAARENENVVSVIVPASVSIAIKTSIVDGRILDFIGGTAEVSSSDRSYAPIALSVTSVEDAQKSGHAFLPYVDMILHGDHDYSVVEGGNQSAPLFDGIAPGTSETLEASIAQKLPDVLIPAGSYLVRATLRVEPVAQT